MRIQKFEADTEVAALEKVRDSLGEKARVLQIQQKRANGFLGWFKKPTIEVTAAIALENGKSADSYERVSKTAMEDKINKSEEKNANNQGVLVDTSGFDKMKETVLKDNKIEKQAQLIQDLQEKLKDTQQVLEKVSSEVSVERMLSTYKAPRKYALSVIQLLYESLLEKGVHPEVAESILSEVDISSEGMSKDTINVDLLVSIVYKKVLDILGEPAVIEDFHREENVAFFFGSTGVGKTTTIAKLTADFTINKEKSVSLITADTYRIAAVEQLKVYGDILGIDVKVAYTPEDMKEAIDSSKKTHELVFVDTAGRSHKNNDSMKDIFELVHNIPHAKKFLVLSVATRFEDLIEILSAYEKLGDMYVIFTKLDETDKIGSILNVCYATNCTISYVTMGQNVPDDFEVIRPKDIAKALLGLGEGYGSSYGSSE